MFQSNRIIGLGVTLAIILSLCGMSLVTTSQAQDFQTVPVLLQAPKVLPREVLSGPNYTIKETVRNDGFVNVYEVDTRYGNLKVESTVLLLKRVGELRALAKIETLQGTDIYLNALKAAALEPVKTAEGLITNPGDTVSGIATGIGSFFSRVSSSVSDSGPHKDNVVNSVSGQASYKREFAHQFGVDPYSSYRPLQKALNDLSWTAAAGGLTVKTALAVIPGAAVTVASYTGTAGSLKNLVKEKTPSELAGINQDKLNRMKVPSPIARIFIQKAIFSPLEQTLIVGELANMKGVADRKYFFETAIGAREESVVVFLHVQAQLMALYQEKTNSVASLVSAGGFPLC